MNNSGVLDVKDLTVDQTTSALAEAYVSGVAISNTIGPRITPEWEKWVAYKEQLLEHLVQLVGKERAEALDWEILCANVLN